MNDVPMAWDSGTRAENWTEYRATESPNMLATVLPEWLITSSVDLVTSGRIGPSPIETRVAAKNLIPNEYGDAIDGQPSVRA